MKSNIQVTLVILLVSATAIGVPKKNNRTPTAPPSTPVPVTTPFPDQVKIEQERLAEAKEQAELNQKIETLKIKYNATTNEDVVWDMFLIKNRQKFSIADLEVMIKAKTPMEFRRTIDKNDFITLVDTGNVSPLMLALVRPDSSVNDQIKDEKLKAINLLITHGADINSPDSFGNVPLVYSLYFATGTKENAGFETLMKYHPNVNPDISRFIKPNSEATLPLHIAVYNGAVRSVDRLLRSGADADAINSRGETALIARIQYPSTTTYDPKDHLAAIQLLLSWKADQNAKIRAPYDFGDNGSPAIVLAARSCGYSNSLGQAFVQTLIEGNANVNNADTYGTSALMWAVQYQNIDLVKMLLKAGANKSARDKSGRTSLDIINDQLNKWLSMRFKALPRMDMGIEAEIREASVIQSLLR